MAPASLSIAYCRRIFTRSRTKKALYDDRPRYWYWCPPSKSSLYRYFNVVATGVLVIAKQANGVNGDMTNGVEEFG
eukprot:scaffold543_cov243-Alexandrium_tamarense.AAC.2